MSITDGGGDAFGCSAAGAATSTITVTGAGTLSDVDVTLNVTHATGSELDVWLLYTPTTGTPACIQLSTDNGAGANYASTVFSDEGASSITAGTSPFTGTFRPESALSTLDAKLRDGTYTIYVNDDTVTTTPPSAALTSWSITYY